MSEPPAKKRSRRTDPAPAPPRASLPPASAPRPGGAKQGALRLRSARGCRPDAGRAGPRGAAGGHRGHPRLRVRQGSAGPLPAHQRGGGSHPGAHGGAGVGAGRLGLLPPEKAAPVIAKDRQVLATGQTLTFEDVEQTPQRRAGVAGHQGRAEGHGGAGVRHLPPSSATSPGTSGWRRSRRCTWSGCACAWRRPRWARGTGIQAGRIRWSENIDSILGGVPGGPGDTYEAFLQRVLAEDRTRFAQQVAAALKAPADFEAEFQVYVPTGAPRWMRSKVRVLRRAGRPRGCWAR